MRVRCVAGPDYLHDTYCRHLSAASEGFGHESARRGAYDPRVCDLDHPWYVPPSEAEGCESVIDMGRNVAIVNPCSLCGDKRAETLNWMLQCVKMI